MFILKEFCDREILLCNFLLHYLNSTPPSRVTRQNFLAMFTSVKSTERWVIGWWKLSMMVFAVLTLYRNVTDRRVSGFATCVASYAVARWKSWIWYIVDRFLTDAMNHRHAKKTFLLHRAYVTAWEIYWYMLIDMARAKSNSLLWSRPRFCDTACSLYTIGESRRWWSWMAAVGLLYL